MFRIHTVLSQDMVSIIVAHLDEHIEPLLAEDVSNYAKGRRRIWLPYEAPLSAARPWVHGVKDERLWDWISRQLTTSAGWTPDLGLISKGGTITRHRDASYAEYRSFGINLGVCTFGYEYIYQQFGWTPGTPEKGTPELHPMSGGEIFSFNAKNPHWAQDVDPNRWGINCWKVSDKEMARFTAFKTGA